MREIVHKQMNEMMNEWNDWLDEWMTDWMSEQMNKWTDVHSEWMNELTNECTSIIISGQPITQTSTFPDFCSWTRVSSCIEPLEDFLPSGMWQVGPSNSSCVSNKAIFDFHGYGRKSIFVKAGWDCPIKNA